MFDLEAQIKRWRDELARTGINATELVDELEGHLRERVDRLIADGFPESEAFQTAVQQLGDGNALKNEFSKLKRSRWRIFHGNPLGINVLAVWFVIMGLNGMIWPLRRAFIDVVQRFFENYSFKGIWPNGFDWNGIIFGGLWILIGIGLLRRWKICRILGLVYALLQSYYWIYYFVLGHPLPGAPVDPLPANVVVHFRFLGLPLPDAFRYVVRYLGLTIWVWGIYALLRPPVEKLFRRVTAE